MDDSLAKILRIGAELPAARTKKQRAGGKTRLPFYSRVSGVSRKRGGDRGENLG
jgi:hypothetical protein